MTFLKTSLVLGTAGFVAYCFYFDHKRRSDPDFRKKLMKRRAQQKEEKDKSVDDLFDVPTFENPNAMQEYFLEQISLGDCLLQRENFELGAIHLAKAIVVSTQKQELLTAFNRSLPEPVFQLILKCYQKANDRFIRKMLLNPDIGEHLSSIMCGRPGASGSGPAIKNSEASFKDTDVE